LPPASTKQEAQAVPQHNGFSAPDCSMMRPERMKPGDLRLEIDPINAFNKPHVLILKTK